MQPLSETDLILNSDGSVYHLGLKSGQVAKKIITVGDPDRVHKVSSHFDHIEFKQSKREFTTHTGSYKGKRISVISSGMGTENVEILMNELDAVFNIDLTTRTPKEQKTRLRLIRVGTSASIQKDLPLGSHLLSENAIGLDPILHFYQTGMSPSESAICDLLKKEIGLPYTPYFSHGSATLLETFQTLGIKGNTVTCPGFYGPQGRSLRMPIRFPDLLEVLEHFNLDNFVLSNLEMETAGYYALSELLGHEMISMNAIIANRITQTFSKNADEIVDELILKVLEKI